MTRPLLALLLLAATVQPLVPITTHTAIAPVATTTTCHASPTLADTQAYFGLPPGTPLPFAILNPDKTTIAWGKDELLFVRSPGHAITLDAVSRSDEQVVVTAHETGMQADMTLVIVLPNHTIGKRGIQCRVKDRAAEGSPSGKSSSHEPREPPI